MINNLDLMRARLQLRGGVSQQDRMIQDKKETLNRAILYSYQGAQVQAEGTFDLVPALINPNRITQNYDDKIISIGYEYNFKPGTVFNWVNTGTQWLIYLQDLTELAYFKGDCRKCNYKISWEQDNKKFSTYAAIKGPVETNIDYVNKSNMIIDLPNHTLNILLPATEDTLAYFKRYAKFYLKSVDNYDTSVCWQVEATDSISTPGILEINAVEYYSNKFEDDLQNGIAGGLIVEPTIPEPAAPEIKGEVFIKPKRFYTYKYTGNDEGSWIYDSKLPLEVKINDKEVSIKWTTTYNGQFTLGYGDKEKTIVVESLF